MTDTADNKHLPYQNYLSCLLIAGICLFAFFLPDSIYQQLVLSQTGIRHWELWRSLSAHFVHTNHWHLLLNLGGLLLTWLLFFEYFKWHRILFVVLVCTIGLSVLLLVTGNLENIAWYAGLSGTLHGIFAFALLLDISTKRKSTYILIALGLSKLLYEQLGGSTLQTASLIGANVAINAHLWGAVLGVVAGLTVKYSGREAVAKEKNN
jgi:rhomboid family GlyGly-CTERM serine protease